MLTPPLEGALSSESGSARGFVKSEPLEFTKHWELGDEVSEFPIAGGMAPGRLSWVAGGDSRPSRRLSSSSKVEEERRCALRRRDREANGLALQSSLHERAWGDERHLMQQELRSLKQNLFLFYVKLRWLLKHWRQGRQAEDDMEDFMEVARPRESYGVCS